MKKFELSRNDEIIAGVCGGLAKYFNVDSTWVRIGWAVLSAAFPVLAVVYVLVGLLAPRGEN